MFEHLPVISEDSLRVMVEQELSYFNDLLVGAMQEARSPSEAIERVFSVYGVNASNPLLVRAVKVTYGAEGGMAAVAGLLTVLPATARQLLAGLLAVLRLIDRELEAKEKEQS